MFTLALYIFSKYHIFLSTTIYIDTKWNDQKDPRVHEDHCVPAVPRVAMYVCYVYIIVWDYLCVWVVVCRKCKPYRSSRVHLLDVGQVEPTIYPGVICILLKNIRKHRMFLLRYHKIVAYTYRCRPV